MKKLLFVCSLLSAVFIKSAQAEPKPYAKISKRKKSPQKPYARIMTSENEDDIAKERRREQNRASAQRARLKKKELIAHLKGSVTHLEASVFQLMKQNTQQTETVNRQAEMLATHDKTVKEQDMQIQQLNTLCSQLKQNNHALQQERAVLAEQLVLFKNQQQFVDSLFASHQPSSLVYNEAATATFGGPTVSYQLQSSLTQL